VNVLIGTGVTDYLTDGGGIRGFSELLMIKGIMHRLMVEENTERKRDGRASLPYLPKPCDYFDLIGGTSTGGYATVTIIVTAMTNLYTG